MMSVNRKDILIPENIPRKLAPEVFVGTKFIQWRIFIR